MVNIVISLIFALCLLSCTQDNIYQHHKIPIENNKYLNNGNNSSVIPNTKPQYGNYNRPINNNKFYNSIFNDKKPVIYDNVANNNLPKIAKPVVAKKRVVTKKTSKQFYIQVGAYSKVKNVQKTQAKVQKYGNLTFEEIVKGKKNITIVRIGPVTTLRDAVNIQGGLYKDGFKKAIIREVK